MYLSVPTTISRLATNVFIRILEAHSASRWHALKQQNHTPETPIRIAKGFVFGFEMHPLAYRYDLIQICPKGFDKYNASHHNIKIFEMPVVKLGFRF